MVRYRFAIDAGRITTTIFWYAGLRWLSGLNALLMSSASSPRERQAKMSDDDMKQPSRTDWDRLETMNDEDIDYSDIPPLTDAFFARAQRVLPNVVPLDPDILAWFRQHDRNYAERINQILRQYIAIQDRAA